MSADIPRSEAERVLKQAFPENTPTIEKIGVSGAWHIKDKDGNRVGSAFNLRVAVQQAVRPFLEQEAKKLLATQEEKKQEFMDFMGFLKEKHRDEFDQWRAVQRLKREAEAQIADSARNDGGAQPHPKQLVHLE